MDKVRIVMVEYLNTIPFVDALKNSPLMEWCDIIFKTPSECARSYFSDDADIALVPSLSYIDQPLGSICSSYGIGCNGAVRTVGLFSNQDIREVKKIYLDSHSRSSVGLLKVLCKYHWKIEVSFEPVTCIPNQLESDEAVLMIGDKVFDHEGTYKNFYDLGKTWKEFTGLPFLFAIWVSKDHVSKEIVNHLEESFLSYFSKFSENLDSLVSELKTNIPSIKSYFLDNLDYNRDSNMIKGYEKFKSHYLELPQAITT